jgi:hypothetical protein
LKFDFSTILIVIVAVIPGLFAQRTRNQLIPRSFAPQGASAELAELVALGISTHGIIVLFCACCLFLRGWLRWHDPFLLFSILDSENIGAWCSKHVAEAFLYATVYVLASLVLSHWLGFIYGIWRYSSPFTTFVFAKATWLAKRGITGLLGERPIIYEVLNPAIDNGEAKSVFVEVEMKDALGFYSGQLSQFAIVQDEEPHKPIFLIDVWFKKERNDVYDPVETDGIMIDLADTVTLLVKQVHVSEQAQVSDATAGASPSQEEISSLAYQIWTDSGRKDGTAEQNWSNAEQQLTEKR